MMFLKRLIEIEFFNHLLVFFVLLFSVCKVYSNTVFVLTNVCLVLKNGFFDGNIVITKVLHFIVCMTYK